MTATWFMLLMMTLIIVLGTLAIGIEDGIHRVNSQNSRTSGISLEFGEMGYVMKLYLVHCGFYDLEICDGLYESHVNFFVVAESFDDARAKAKLIPEFRAKKMHIDGLQEIVAVGGHRIQLEEAFELQGETVILNHRHRDLSPKTSTQVAIT